MSDTGFYAEKAMEVARGYGQSEVYVSEAVINTVYIDDSKISNIETKLDSGLMIRIADGGRQGKASVTLNGEQSVKECMSMAESVLRYSPESTEFKGYAQQIPETVRHNPAGGRTFEASRRNSLPSRSDAGPDGHIVAP